MHEIRHTIPHSFYMWGYVHPSDTGIDATVHRCASEIARVRDDSGQGSAGVCVCTRAFVCAGTCEGQKSLSGMTHLGFFLHLFICCVCHHPCHAWRSEDNLEFSLPTMWELCIELRSSGMATNNELYPLSHLASCPPGFFDRVSHCSGAHQLG